MCSQMGFYSLLVCIWLATSLGVTPTMQEPLAITEAGSLHIARFFVIKHNERKRR